MTEIVSAITTGVSAIVAAWAAVWLKALLERRGAATTREAVTGPAGAGQADEGSESAAADRAQMWPLLLLGGVLVAGGTWNAAESALLPSSVAVFVARFSFPLLVVAVGGMLIGVWVGRRVGS